MAEVEKQIRRKETKPKDSRGSTLPETRELMKLFATATQLTTTSKQIEDTQTQQGSLKKGTIEVQQQPAEILEPEEQESDHAPTIPTQTPQEPSEIPIAPSTTSQVVNPPPTAPAPLPAPVLIPSAPIGCTRCPHCRKTFTQPLRMLVFHDDRLRIINLCPFCNEIIPSNPRREEVE